MLLTYNSIPLQIEHVLFHDERAIYSPDGVDYLYTHHRIGVRCIWNPAATSDAGKVAAESIDALRATLLTPRKTLLFYTPQGGAGGSKRVLRSPLKDPAGVAYPCDANNGPKPTDLNVVSYVGEQSAIIDFVVETWVNECTAVIPLLSHRWEMSSEIDRDYYTTRTITGTAIFRTDFLASRAPVAHPDDYRAVLLHPVPENFKRDGVRVQSTSDGTTLSYTVVDVEQPKNILDRRISRVEGTFSDGTDQVPVPSGGIELATHFLPGNWLSCQFANTTRELVLHVYGTRQATNRDLFAAAMRISAACGFGPAGPIIPYEMLRSANFTLDIFNRRATVVFRSNLPSGLRLGAAFFAAVGLPALGGIAGANASSLPDNLGADLVVTTGETTNPPNASATRGTWVAHLVAQGLREVCAAPAKPSTSITNTEGTNRDYTI